MPDDIPQNYRNNLDRARQEKPGPVNNKNPIAVAKNLKNLNRALTPMGFFSLLKEVNLLTDLPFMAAFMFALLKDILDLVFTATVILPMLFSVLCSIFIFMMMILAGSGGKRKIASGLVKKSIAIVGGGLADAVPGLGLLPVATLTVGVVYFMTLFERANAKK